MSTVFVAEVSSNHHQQLERCFAFIDSAAAIGCQAVKFQLFRIDQLFAPEILRQSEKHRQRADWELPLEFLPHLAQRCREVGILFCCTPFYLEAVAQLKPYVDFYKIASYELLLDELIRACAATGKPLVLSTGMASLAEIDHAVAVFRDHSSAELTLLHCVSGYPVPPEECNLAALETLRQRYGCRVGWSDHSRRPEVVQRSVQHWQADMVEFHLDLEGEGAEYAAGHCWLPQEMKSVIDALAVARVADGDGSKTPQAVELPDRDWRADPVDGLRPLLSVRKDWHG